MSGQAAKGAGPQRNDPEQAMARDREIRAFDYVNQPYAKVRDALHADALEIVRSATQAAASRAHSVAAGLHINLAGVKIGAEIDIEVGGIIEDTGETHAENALHVDLEWEAAKAPRLFPLMRGRLSAWPLSGTETQLAFDGRYQPPLGALGTALDAMVGHRIADASVHRFITDIAAYLRQSLSGP
jgi:hypothetical protein